MTASLLAGYSAARRSSVRHSYEEIYFLSYGRNGSWWLLHRRLSSPGNARNHLRNIDMV